MSMIKKYILGVIFIIMAFVLLIAPFTALVIYRSSEWIYVVEKTKIAIGVIIGILYMVLVIKGILKKIAPLSSTLISAFIMTIIAILIKSVIVDLPYIFGAITIGLGLFIIFYKIGARLIEIAKIYNDETIRQKARAESPSGTTNLSGRI